MNLTRTAALLPVLLSAFGCGEGSSPAYDLWATTVHLTVRDLQTGITSDGGVPGGPGEGPRPVQLSFDYAELEAFVANEEGAWNGNVRVVRWPSGELDAGEWRLARASRDGGVELTFLPEGALASGWHAVQINFPEIHERQAASERSTGLRRGIANSGLPIADGWTTARFHVGSFPILRVIGSVATEASASRAGQYMEIQSSELIEIAGDVDFMDTFRVRANNESVACRSADETRGSSVFGPSRPFSTITVWCETVPAGADVTMTVEAGFTDARDIGLHDLQGRSPPLWLFTAAAAPEGDDGPSDALFTVRSSADEMVSP